MEDQPSIAVPRLALLAGGMATRLWPTTKELPKAMIEVAGKPFIAHQLDLIKRENITDVIICAGYLGLQIQNFVQDGERFSLRVSYSFDGEKLLGTGGAIRKALPLLGDIFWVMYGDSYLDITFSPILDYFLSTDKKGLMTLFRNNSRWGSSNVLFANGQIYKYDKKSPNPAMQHIDYGLSLLRKEALADVSEGMAFDLADLYQDLVDLDEMLGYEVKHRFYEIGSPHGLQETAAYLSGKD